MNSIVHFELPAKNVSEMQKFYTEMFGWKMLPMPEMGYTIVYTSEVDDKNMPTTRGAVNGGMLSIEDNGGLNPILVIDVENIDEHLERLVNAGAKVVQPKHPVGTMGFYAKFEDPSGVVMGIWESVKGS